MIAIDNRYCYFKDVLDKIIDDSKLVHAATIDALYKWKEKDQALSYIEMFLLENYNIKREKLIGITLSLIEYQFCSRIPTSLINSLKRLVTARIYDDQEGSEQIWINNVLIILENDLTIENYEWLFSILNDKKRLIPKVHVEHFLYLTKKYIEKHQLYKEAENNDSVVKLRNELKQINKKHNNLRYVKKYKIDLVRSLDRRFFSKVRLSFSSIKYNYHKIFTDFPTAISTVGATSAFFALAGYYFMKDAGGHIIFPACYVALYLLLLIIFHKFFKRNL